MLIKRYKVIAIEPALRAHLAEHGQPIFWSVVANDMHSAWNKFCTQRFGVLKPNAADYDISLERE